MSSAIAPNNVIAIKRAYKQLAFDYDAENRILWGYMTPTQLPNFNLDMLREMRAFDAEFERNGCKVLQDEQLAPVDFYVAASKIDGIFNLGGDLALFLLLIKSRSREGLAHYAQTCIESIYPRTMNYGSNQLTTIGLIQGDALGGGFELALANDVIIAERGVTMGFPEILFNLFPGMGALSLLARKIGMRDARKLVCSGNMYTAEELHAMGVVDVLADENQGALAVLQYVRDNARRTNGLNAIRRACQRVDPLTKEELMDITNIWVDAALQIGDKDLRMIERIVKTQRRRMGLDEAAPAAAAQKEATMV